MNTPCRFGSTVAVAFSLLSALPSQADVVGSNTLVNFAGSSTSFSYGGSTFTLSDNMSGFASPVSVMTAGGAMVRTIFGQPSVDFQTGIFYDEGFIQYASFAQSTPISFSGTPSSLGLKVTASDGVHYGYALFSGTTLQSYGFNTVVGQGIMSGAAITPVPEPASVAMMLAGVGVLAAAIRRRGKHAEA